MLHSLSPGELCSLAGSVQRASRRVCDERIFEMSRLSRVRFHHVTIDPTDSDHNDPICPNLFTRKQTFAMQNEMSTSGQKQTYAAQSAMSALPPSGHVQCNSACPLSANSGHCPPKKKDRLARRSLLQRTNRTDQTDCLNASCAA
jgi:hypothetical protein